MTEPMRVIYMGTPDYAIPALKVLQNSPLVEVRLVVTQPDRPQGRGRQLQSPPVKLAADELGLETLQVDTLKTAETRYRLESAQPDLIVVAAFGVILGTRTLSLPRLGCVNLHASLLPAYRGANPIAAAIAMGERETGVTLMQMDRGLDTGPILASQSTPIELDDTTESLTERLAHIGSELLGDQLAVLLAGKLEPRPQPDGGTLTRPMTKDDGWVDWSAGALAVVNHVRAMQPWPRAWTTLPGGDRVQVHGVVLETESDVAGRISISGSLVRIGCGSGRVQLSAVQFAGGNRIEGAAIRDRFRSFDGELLGAGDKPDRWSPLVTSVP